MDETERMETFCIFIQASESRQFYVGPNEAKERSEKTRVIHYESHDEKGRALMLQTYRLDAPIRERPRLL